MKLLFVDLDGTIREPLSGAKFINRPRDQKIITGADKAIAHYHRQYKIIGITNQAGVAAGHKSLKDCIDEQFYTLNLFPEIHAISFCPDFEGNEAIRCDRESWGKMTKYPDLVGTYRKPGAGMLRYWLIQEEILPEDCWMIGDRDTDEQAATNCGVGFMPADIWRDRWSHIYQ